MNLDNLKNGFVRSELYKNAQIVMSLSGSSSEEIENYLFNDKLLNFKATTQQQFQSFNSNRISDSIYCDNRTHILHGTTNYKEYIFIRSDLFGRIQNSMFNLNGVVLNSSFKCGYCEVSDIKPMYDFNLVKMINSIIDKNTNNDFSCLKDYLLYCQNKHGFHK